MYLLDNNFIIDTLADRRNFKEQYSDILIYCLKEGIACICTNQIDTLRYIIKKDYSDIYDTYLDLEKRVHIIKTPSYIDFENQLAIMDMEDYMIEISAISVGAKIITSDKKFLALSDITLSPKDFYLHEENKTKNIDFANLKKQHYLYHAEIEKEIDQVLNKTNFIMGEPIKTLEKSLEEFTGAKHAITCSSGTDALLLAMMALDIKPDDEIITTPFTFIATAETIAFLGAKPVFVDIDEKTYNIDPSKIEEAITDKTKAIMPVSLYGQPADMDAIQAVIEKVEEGRRKKEEGRRDNSKNPSTFPLQPSTSKIKIIIDGAQSFGSTYKGKTDSNLGDISTTSFFPAKPLGCYGDGGAVFTNDTKLAEKMKSLRVHGQNKRYHHKYIGIGGRMDTIQCAIVDVKLKYYKKDLALRQEVAEKYTEALKDKDLVLPFVDSQATSAFAQYSVRIQNRNKLQAKLKEQGIPTAVHYPMPLHLQECFAYLGYKEGEFPISELVSSEIMSLPMNPYLSDDEINYISKTL